MLEVRENWRVVNVHASIAAGVNAKGYQEVWARRNLRRGRFRLIGVLPMTSVTTRRPKLPAR
ncbi:hypothetical protein AZG88_39120 [Rhodococcus sp. LB1]|nr:hypothetical protein AZG88_39120 [Rhodococcus sp. LB1]